MVRRIDPVSEHAQMDQLGLLGLEWRGPFWIAEFQLRCNSCQYRQMPDPLANTVHFGTQLNYPEALRFLRGIDDTVLLSLYIELHWGIRGYWYAASSLLPCEDLVWADLRTVALAVHHCCARLDARSQQPLSRNGWRFYHVPRWKHGMVRCSGCRFSGNQFLPLR